MLQAGAVHACDKSICGHSEDCSSRDKSFCFQVKIQQIQAEGKKIPSQAKTPSDKKLVSQSKIGHLHRCQHHAG